MRLPKRKVPADARRDHDTPVPDIATDRSRSRWELSGILLRSVTSLLRYCFIEVPRIHDVSEILRAESARLPDTIRPHVEELAAISRSLRRDRELAFYGSEDLTPSNFYSRADAEAARAGARRVVDAVTSAVRR